MTTVAVLGSTGSIGTQTLDIIRTLPDDYQLVALGAARSVDRVAEQVREFGPACVAMTDESAAGALREAVGDRTEVLSGPEALAAASADADIVINGVVGFAGLPVTLTALAAGRRLGLANKESLIAAGPLVATVRDAPGAELIPVDSEHCALHQCLRATADRSEVERIVLTASGGPFRGRSTAALESVSVSDALAHPTWNMGPKITVDSSTLMNKGLEVIEAHELFGVSYEQIGVVVHPQSIVHSMVSYRDGATIAQLSLPDMRLCIGYALAHPNRLPLSYGAIDWSEIRSLDFEPPDLDAFRCLSLAYAAGRAGQTAPARLSAANEVAVDAFLEGLIGWTQIADVVEEALDGHDDTPAESIDAILDVDRRARRDATEIIERKVAA